MTKHEFSWNRNNTFLYAGMPRITVEGWGGHHWEDQNNALYFYFNIYIIYFLKIYDLKWLLCSAIRLSFWNAMCNIVPSTETVRIPTIYSEVMIPQITAVWVFLKHDGIQNTIDFYICFFNWIGRGGHPKIIFKDRVNRSDYTAVDFVQITFYLKRILKLGIK